MHMIDEARLMSWLQQAVVALLLAFSQATLADGGGSGGDSDGERDRRDRQETNDRIHGLEGMV